MDKTLDVLILFNWVSLDVKMNKWSMSNRTNNGQDHAILGFRVPHLTERLGACDVPEGGSVCDAGSLTSPFIALCG